MIQFPQSPGVIVDEINKLSLSVGSATTAVPVFAIGHTKEEPWWDAINKPVKLNSFEDFLSFEKQNNDASGAVAVSLSALWQHPDLKQQGPTGYPRLRDMKRAQKGNAVAGDPWIKPFAPALKAYFDNGGGYCYVCPYNKLDLVLTLSDVTLIVQCGQADATSDILKVCVPGNGLFALLDGPGDDGPFDLTTFNEFYKTMVPSDCAAVYYPWLKADWAVVDNSGNPVEAENIHNVSPSAVAAGLICKTDRLRGPWKSPANVAISAGLTPAVKIGDATQKIYTDSTKMAVNMIRTFPGKGTLIWGARTLTTGGNNWSYINVRRTFDMIERDIGVALLSVLYEPNGPATWEVVRSAIDNYLYNLWKKGALYGVTPESGYRIEIGNPITMTQADIESGTLNVRVKVSVVRPAEFVVLQFTQQVASGG